MSELGNISVGEVGKEMGRRWAELDKDKKGKYETIQAKAKVKYEEEMKNYQPSKEFLEMKAEQDKKKLTGTEHMAEGGRGAADGGGNRAAGDAMADVEQGEGGEHQD